MKKVFLALLPAIIAHILWLFISRPPIKVEIWVVIIVVTLLIGGILSAKFLISYMQESNVERGVAIKALVGVIVVILYVAIFFFSGCSLGVATGR